MDIKRARVCHWNHVDYERKNYHPLVNTVIELWVPWKEGNLFITCGDY
jgi:hypothetical protein